MRLSDAPLFSEEQIARRVEALAAQIATDYAAQSLTLLIVLKGAAWFGADLVRRLPGDTLVEFIRAKSYAGDTSTGEVRFPLVPEVSLAGRHVLLIEDILDTGRTLDAVTRLVEAQAPASLRACALLDKPSRRVFPARAHYVGFEVPDQFVVGYGLDHDEHYRTLPAIYTLLPD